MFTKALALEVAKFGINVNAIAPGGIITKGSRKVSAALRNEEAQKVLNEFLRLIPLGRLGNPDDGAKVAVFLASPAADYITGSMSRRGRPPPLLNS